MVMWLKPNHYDSDVVISTRVRLARNAAKTPFPHMLPPTGQEKIKQMAKDAFLKGNSDFVYYDVKDLSPAEKMQMVEKHVASRDLVNRQSSGLIISRDESISIMLLEEDHFRLQCIRSGLDLEGTYDIIKQIDRMLQKEVEYAYDEQFGYLTACPTNVGTGLRASVMVHLPGLVGTGLINQIATSIGRLGYTVRGYYGEGSQGNGDIYQVSNDVTLGHREEEILQSLKAIVNSIIQQERKARQTIVKDNPAGQKDRVMRAYGLLKNAYMMGSQEATQLLSIMNLAQACEAEVQIDPVTLYGLMMDVKPAMIMGAENLSQQERDIKRAEMLRRYIITNER